MDTDARGFPLGDMRVSDADRDRALSELSEAFRVGRITADEFDERAGQVLGARTGKELTIPLADLPIVQASAGTAVRRRADRASPIFVCTSLGAAYFTVIALTNALNRGPNMSVPPPPGQGIDWAGTIAPGAIAVLLVLVMIFLRVARSRKTPHR
jgi:Domain of unknown function (DUF1707)